MSAAVGRSVRAGLLVPLSLVYVVLLVWLVLWKLHAPYVDPDPAHIVKLVPFVAAGDAGRSAPWEIAANVVLFVPFGVYVRLLRPAWPWAAAVVAAAGASVALECVQFATGVGIADISDVISNTAGAGIGIASVTLSRVLMPRRGEWAWVVTALAATAAVGVVLADAFRAPGGG